jgi:hypothetical protein
MRRGVKNCRIFSNIFKRFYTIFKRFISIFERFQTFSNVSKHELARLVLPHFTHLAYLNLTPKPCPLYPNSYIRSAQVGRL